MKSHAEKLLIFCITILITETFAQRIPSIAVLDFERTSDISEAQAAVLSDQIRLELIQMRLYSVIERGQLNMILQEQSMQTSGICNTSECAVQIGQMIGADEIITGSVGKFGSLWVMNLRRIDVGTGQILEMARTQTNGSIENLLTKGVAEAIKGLQLDSTEPPSGKAEEKTPEKAPASDSTPSKGNKFFMQLSLNTPFASVAEGIAGIRYHIGYGPFSIVIGYGTLAILAELNKKTIPSYEDASIRPVIGFSYRKGIHEILFMMDSLQFTGVARDDGSNVDAFQFQYHADLGEPGKWGILMGLGQSTTSKCTDYSESEKECLAWNKRDDAFVSFGFSYKLGEWKSK